MKAFLTVFLAAGLPLAALAADAPAPAGPAVTITLGSRHGHVTPERRGCNHTGGGNIDVQQPSPDTVVITMTGVTVAYAHPFKTSSATMHFDLDQCFEVGFADAKVKAAKFTVEARVIGLLRGGSKGGSAGFSEACVSISGGPLCIEPHGVAGCDNQSMNCRQGPLTLPAFAGKYTLHQSFTISANHTCGCGKAASAEFAPDPALDPLWISYWEPFHGAAKKDFGFQVTLKVADDTPAEPKKAEK